MVTGACLYCKCVRSRCAKVCKGGMLRGMQHSISWQSHFVPSLTEDTCLKIKVSPDNDNGVLAGISSWLRRWPTIHDAPGIGVLGRVSWLATFRQNEARIHQPSVDVDCLHRAGSRGTDCRQAAKYASANGTSRAHRPDCFWRGLRFGACYQCRYQPRFFSAAGLDRCNRRSVCRLSQPSFSGSQSPCAGPCRGSCRRRDCDCGRTAHPLLLHHPAHKLGLTQIP